LCTVPFIIFLISSTQAIYEHHSPRHTVVIQLPSASRVISTPRSLLCFMGLIIYLSLLSSVLSRAFASHPRRGLFTSLSCRSICTTTNHSQPFRILFHGLSTSTEELHQGRRLVNGAIIPTSNCSWPVGTLYTIFDIVVYCGSHGQQFVAGERCVRTNLTRIRRPSATFAERITRLKAYSRWWP
jgi:hypothetical protein